MANPIKAPHIRRIIAILILLCFSVSGLNLPFAQAQDIVLPKPGVRVGLSPEFNPPVLRGVTVDPNNPFKFDFILDKGDSPLSSPNALVGDPQQEQLKEESKKLVKYFLAAITTPEKDLWVNLSPYEKQRIIPESFGQTDMGRDLLAQDYILKQITASLIYPEDEIGKEFWKRIYEEAAKKFGTTNIPVSTFNKVWIVPEKAKVYEYGNTAFVINSKLKVMLENDYVAMSKNSVASTGPVPAAPYQSSELEKLALPVDRAPASGPPVADANKLGESIIREIILPQLEKEVNEGKNFAPLRQVYNSLILAVWFKKRMKNSILGRKYMDQNKTSNLSSPNASVGDPDLIYQRYLQAFKKGVYNYIKEEPDAITGNIIPRKYFSGGAEFNLATSTTDIVSEMNSENKAMISSLKTIVRIAVNLIQTKSTSEKEELYRKSIAQRVLSVLQHGLISPIIARERGIDLFRGADGAGNDKYPLVAVEEMRDFESWKKYRYEDRFIDPERAIVEYKEWIDKVAQQLFADGRHDNNPIEILAERNAVWNIYKDETSEVEERLKSGVMILMRTDEPVNSLFERSKTSEGANIIGFPEISADLIEAIFVPKDIFDSVFQSVPLKFKFKLVKVDKEIVPTRGYPAGWAVFRSLKIPDWYNTLIQYLQKNNKNRTLMMHGMRLPTRKEIGGTDSAKLSIDPAMNAQEKLPNLAMVSNLANLSFDKDVKWTQRVWIGRLRNKAGKYYYLKTFASKGDRDREFFAYKVAKLFKVNIPQFEKVSPEQLKNVQGWEVKYSYRHAILLQDVNDMKTKDLNQEEGSGLEEMIAFTHFMRHTDLITEGNKFLRSIGGKQRHILIDLLTDLRIEQGSFLNPDRSQDHGGLVFAWAEYLMQVNADKLNKVISRIEKMSAKELNGLSSDVDANEVGSKYVLGRQKALRNNIIEGLREYQRAYADDEVIEDVLERIISKISDDAQLSEADHAMNTQEKSSNQAMVSNLANLSFDKDVKWTDKVWIVRLQDKDGKHYYLKFFASKGNRDREFFAYKVAQLFGVNIPKFEQVSQERLINVQGLQLKEGYEHAILLQDANEMEANDLNQKEGSGLEEVIAFTHFMRHIDLLTDGNRFLRNIDGQQRHILIDLLTDLRVEQWPDSNPDKDQRHFGLVFTWSRYLLQVNAYKLNEVISRIEKISAQQLNDLSSGVDANEVGSKHFVDRQKAFRNNIIEGLRDYKADYADDETSKDAIEKIINKISDHAQLSEADQVNNNEQNPGGIDLTADRMKLDIEKDKAQIGQPMDLKVLENIEINGLYIKDIEIKPLNNLPQLLGIGSNS